jgi:hypothetical protein
MKGVVAPCDGRVTEPPGGTWTACVSEMFDCVISKFALPQPLGRLAGRSVAMTLAIEIETAFGLLSVTATGCAAAPGYRSPPALPLIVNGR